MPLFYKFCIQYFLLATFINSVRASLRHKESSSKPNCIFSGVTISVLADPPYARTNRTDGVVSDFIRLGIKQCFKSKSCVKVEDIQWNWVQTEDELENVIKNEQTNIAFPVPPSLLSSRRTRFSSKARVEYFSVLHSPGPALIVNNQACRRLSKLLLVKTILSVWPVLLLTMLLAGISGVCIWALEYRNNQPRHFSKPFAKGSYDGFWWAVVSMTTVGYGDQIPRSIIGRLFGMVWILTGVTLIAVLTASITSAITVVSVQGSCNGMQGQHIAVVNNSEVEVTARHHGAVVKVYDTVMAMFNDLKSEQVDGILMDRLKAYYYLNIMDDDKLRVSVLDGSMYYSVAVVPGNTTAIITNNSCFMDLLANPRGKMNRLMKKYIVPVKAKASSEDAIGLFSSDSGALTNTLLTIAVLLVILLMCGLAWERLYKGNRCFTPTDVPRQVLTNTDDIAMGNQSSVNQLDQLQSALKTLNEQILELKATIGSKAQEKEAKIA